MRKLNQLICLRWLAMLCGLCCLLAEAGSFVQAAEPGELLFVRRIKPLLQEKCIACHGADEQKIEGGLKLESATDLQTGGDSGEPAVIAGQPEHSPLYLAATWSDDNWSAMPPKQSEQLNQEQLAWLSEWIKAGAIWPTADRQTEILKQYEDSWSAEDGIRVKTSGGLADDWTNRKYDPASLWAYQPLHKPNLAIPESDPTHPIDHLIQRQWPDGLNPAGRADRLTLIRRVSFDLTGLPPTPQQVDQFVHDQRDDKAAFAAVVDRLLESPHYGERMAQHWLDVVRYADSSGLANDYERGNAWRYRDYVVRSFKADKPYPQFVREQLAGDEIAPADPEAIVATGFLRMGPWELTGMEVAKVARQRFLDDVTNSVGETFLAHALQCARCHDHKFDPVPTGDYYSIQAVFATTQLAERKAEFLDEENQDGFDERKYLDLRKSDYQKMLVDLDNILLDNAAAWYEQNGISPEQWNATVAQIQSQKGPGGVFNAARNRMRQQKIAEDQFPPKLVGFTPDQFGLERVARKGLSRLSWEADRYKPFALAVYSGKTPNLKAVYQPLRKPDDPTAKGDLEQTCILTGGDPFASGAPVEPGVLSVLSGVNTAFPLPEIPTTITGRRTAFANWVVNEHNPLTPRVLVNRLWLWHFNQPLAGNPNNFGATGKRPTHPELLDWLAADLIDNGWSIKSLQRQMLNTDAYARSSEHPHPSGLNELDPLGTSYAAFQPRRLSAEELRDAMLAATGELNPTIGGIPCRPQINQEAALQPRQVMGSFASAWIPNPRPEQRHRRSLYVLRLRGLSVPMFEVFNSPAPDFSCEQRTTSNVTPQVFSLLNGNNSHTRALVLAQRAVAESANDDAAAIDRCFELVYSRQPTAAERELCLKHWQQIEQTLPAKPLPGVKPPLTVVRNAIEENTGERFQFEEQLHSNREFVPDLQPADVTSHVRALADVCLVLFNSSEFAYVY